jgi:hypothetical protein
MFSRFLIYLFIFFFSFLVHNGILRLFYKNLIRKQMTKCKNNNNNNNNIQFRNISYKVKYE